MIIKLILKSDLRKAEGFSEKEIEKSERAKRVLKSTCDSPPQGSVKLIPLSPQVLFNDRKLILKSYLRNAEGFSEKEIEKSERAKRVLKNTCDSPLKGSLKLTPSLRKHKHS